MTVGELKSLIMEGQFVKICEDGQILISGFLCDLDLIHRFDEYVVKYVYTQIIDDGFAYACLTIVI